MKIGFKFGDLLSTAARAAVTGMRKRTSIPLAVVPGEIGMGVYVDSSNAITHLTAFLACDGQGGMMKCARRDKAGDWEEVEAREPEGGRKILYRIDVTADQARPIKEGERLTSFRVRFTPSGRVLYSLETPEGARFIPQSPTFLVDRSESVWKAFSHLVETINGQAKMIPDASIISYTENGSDQEDRINVTTATVGGDARKALDAVRGEEPLVSAGSMPQAPVSAGVSDDDL